MKGIDYYVALLHKERNTDWGVMFPDLPGCISAGMTFAEAMDMAAEALAGHVTIAREYGDSVPAPRSLEEIRASRKFDVELDGAVVAMVPLLEAADQPVTISVSIDRTLLSAIDRRAEETGRSRSAFLSTGAQLMLRLLAGGAAAKKNKPRVPGGSASSGVGHAAPKKILRRASQARSIRLRKAQG